MKNIFHIFVRVCAYLLLGCFGVCLCLLVAGLCFEQNVPKCVLNWATARISSEEYLVSVDSASFRWTRGLRVRNLKVMDKGRIYGPTNEPARAVMRASLVDAKLDLCRFPWSLATVLRSVTVTDFQYPRLPLGYYVPDSVEFPGQPDFRESSEPVVLKLPSLRPFRVRLIKPRILGVSAPLVDVAFAEVTPNGFCVRGVTIEWEDTDVVQPLKLHGAMSMDLRNQVLQGEVRGYARQHHIRPMLEALEIFNSFQFIDAFTNVEKPVDASCRFDVDLVKKDLHLLLDLHPEGGRHHGVPLKRVDGTVDIRVFVRDIYQNAQIVVGPVQGALADGSAVEGTVVYESTNDIPRVSFDVRTRAPIKDVLAIADVMNDGTLDCLEITNCTPRVTLQGRLAVNDADAEKLNDLAGTLDFREGSVFGIALRNAGMKFLVEGTTVTFTNAVANGRRGGTVTGGGRITVPNSRRDLAQFDLSVNGNALQLADVAEIFEINPDGRHGIVSGNVNLRGPLETNAISRLSGEGRFEVRDGHLAQMKIFAGLTDYLAKHVPGVSGVVNLSRSSLDFKLKDGVFTASNVVVEGDIISVRAEGVYDIVADKLDFRARVTLTRNDSLLGKLATPITWPFANLAKVLLDFRITGSMNDPAWNYSRNPLNFLTIGK